MNIHGGGGGRGWNAHLLKNHGEGGQDRKKIIGRGICQILKTWGGGGGGGGGLPDKKTTSGVGYILHILKSRRLDAKTLP